MPTTFYAALVGVAFRPAGTKDIVRSLIIGDELLLEAEPTNSYHANAVKVLDDEGNHLGYIERDQADEIAPLLAEGAKATAVVQSFLSELKPHLRIEIADEAE